MMAGKWKYLDEHLRLRLADLPSRQFEEFFLHFLRAGISLTVEQHGKQITRRVVSAETYAAGSGRDQRGIDIRVEVEGVEGREIWAFQCKQQSRWTPAETRKAIEKASQYPAQHYFLVVACDPHERVQDEIHKHPNWTFWNLDVICAEFRLRVPPSKHAQVLFFLPPEELKRFVPFTTKALISPEGFFERFIGTDKPFRHDWKLVGRHTELEALRNFLAGPHKVQILAAKGGDGKSRLLWEFCHALAAEKPKTEILCLNPHRSDDDLSFAFIGDPPARVVIVDDAHRAEQVPTQLLALVREDSEKRSSKIILAMRPQGIESLEEKLFKAGLANNMAPQIAFSNLLLRDIRALAAEALGDGTTEQASALAEWTADSPFLAVMAGQLIAQGRLEWGQWVSSEEFRRHVFREFEQTNLESIPEHDRNFASGLLKLLALLAPVIAEPCFVEKAARCLGGSEYGLETQLRRLQQIDLVAGRDDGLRVVPDLFADFLVYDTCHQPERRLSGFVRKILREFRDRSAALIRNLSEATWLARLNGVADEDLLETILAHERSQFTRASFYQRAETLARWSTFSVFLPEESLDLARLAVTRETAGHADDGSLRYGAQDLDTHAHVYEQIPTLVKPIALYHDSYRHKALDLLWELGRRKEGEPIISGQNHPWAVIAEVIRYEPKKRISVILDVLAWLEKRVRSCEALPVLEGPTPVLRVILSPCFEQSVEYTQWEGRTLRLWRQPVDINNTRRIRGRVFQILDWLIEHGSWRAALGALSALEPAVGWIPPFETKQADAEAKLLEEWRPERLKALHLCEMATAKHHQVALRFGTRQMLQRVLAYEKDTAFVSACRRVLEQIPDDLALRVAVVILSQGAFEFEAEEGRPRTPEQQDRVKALWNQHVCDTASQLAACYPDADGFFDFLRRLATELVPAGNHLLLGPLFTDLAQLAPALAGDLARKILEADAATPLARDWTALVEKNDSLGPPQKLALYAKAARGRIPGAGADVIRLMSWRARKNDALADSEKTLLLAIAVRADASEARELLQLVEWSGEANLPWAFEILETLPLREVALQMLEPVFQALMPYRERTAKLPCATVASVLKQLVTVKELDLDRHRHEWSTLIEAYPREVFEFVRARILYAASGQAERGYRPVPSGHLGQFGVPALAKEPDYSAICDDLWQSVLRSDAEGAWHWIPLFQAVVFENPSLWRPRLLQQIEVTSSSEELLWLVRLLNFKGSLIIFRFPDVTRAFLIRARDLGGDKVHRTMRAELYIGCGPLTRTYSGPIIDQESDYVEAAAVKAAEDHAADELLGPFYRWIVKIEQKRRIAAKMQAEADMAGWE